MQRLKSKYPLAKGDGIPDTSSKPIRNEDLPSREVATHPVEKARGQTKWLVNALYRVYSNRWAFSLCVCSITRPGNQNWIGSGDICLWGCVTEWLSIDIYDARGTAVSTSTVPMLAGALLFGPVAALVLKRDIATVAYSNIAARSAGFFSIQQSINCRHVVSGFDRVYWRDIYPSTYMVSIPI